MFGNESADSGNYQVPIRVAHALGRPVVTGLKGLPIEEEAPVCEQEVAGGRDVYLVPLPAVVSVLEGINLPRYPSVPAKLRARQKQVATSRPDRPEPRLEMVRLVVPPGQGKQAEVLGNGPGGGAGGGRDDARDRGRVVVLALVEHEGSEVDELSLQALALARGLVRGAAERTARGARRPRGGRQLGPHGVGPPTWPRASGSTRTRPPPGRQA